MMKSKLISFSILSLLLATSCGGKTETKEDTADEKKPLVKVETVDFRPVVQEGHYTATVEPELINNISAALPQPNQADSRWTRGYACRRVRSWW